MMRGLFQLTWLEIKIFLREPLGAIGTLVDPGGGVPRHRPRDEPRLRRVRGRQAASSSCNRACR